MTVTNDRLNNIEERCGNVENDVKYIKRDVSGLKRDTGEALMRLERVEKKQVDYEQGITRLERARLN